MIRKVWVSSYLSGRISKIDRLGQEYPGVRKFTVREDSLLGGNASDDRI